MENQKVLLKDKHVESIIKLSNEKDSLKYYLTEHLRINGIYWAVTSLALLNRLDALDRSETIKFVRSCWNEENGGFAPHPDHDAHIIPTLSAIQILITFNSISESGIDTNKVISYILSMRPPNEGYFTGDEFGEIDTRITYCAISSLSLLGALDKLDVIENGTKIKDRIANWFKQCMNFDGGFGSTIGGETHAGQVFTAVGALAIIDRLDIIDKDSLSWWLSDRQRPSGGLNGRPQKLEDVCYSWWVLSALSILHKLHWINKDKLINFILEAQDPDDGGIADRPGDMADVFHTVFGIGGLSLLGYEGLAKVDPVYCMPQTIIKDLNLLKSYQLL